MSYELKNCSGMRMKKKFEKEFKKMSKITFKDTDERS